MKRLLLSTVIVFGTLGGLNAAGEFKGGEEGAELAEMSEAARGGAAVSATTAALAAAGAREPIAADYRADLRLAFDRLDAGEYEWKELGRIRRTTLGDKERNPEQYRALERRQARLEETIIKCLDEMTHYRLFVCADVLTPQNILIFVIFLTVNGILVGEGSLYPALPPMAGASIFALANLLVYASVLYAKEYGLPERVTCGTGCHRKAVLDVKDVWKKHLTKPKLKGYVAELLSYVFIRKGDDDYEGSIRAKLEELFSKNDDFEAIKETLLSELPVAEAV